MKLWLAPLHGITRYNFRNLLFRNIKGLEIAITPFLPAQSSEKLNIKNWKDIWPENNPNVEIIPQLMGNKVEDMLDTVIRIKDTYGYSRINWNIGCPVRQVVSRKRGCGLMPYPDMVEDVVENLQSHTDASFSVKMRLGLLEKSEGVEIIRRLNNYNLDFIVIHPRLGIWQYDGTTDLDTFEILLNLSKNKIVYSGDIVDFKSFIKLQSRFPSIDNWMLGRGVLQNPFLPEHILKGEIHDINDEHRRFENFYLDLIETLKQCRDEKGTLANLKELWHYFATYCQLTEIQLKNILKVNDYKEFVNITQHLIIKSFDR